MVIFYVRQEWQLTLTVTHSFYVLERHHVCRMYIMKKLFWNSSGYLSYINCNHCTICTFVFMWFLYTIVSEFLTIIIWGKLYVFRTFLMKLSGLIRGWHFCFAHISTIAWLNLVVTLANLIFDWNFTSVERFTKNPGEFICGIWNFWNGNYFCVWINFIPTNKFSFFTEYTDSV